MDFEDCVYNKTKDGKIMVGGYTLDSILSEYPVMNSNVKENANNIQKGGNFANMFKDLAVPAGLLYLQQKFKPSSNTFSNIEKKGEVIKDSIYDSLVDIVSEKSRVNHNVRTRKSRNKNSKKTRKSRK